MPFYGYGYGYGMMWDPTYYLVLIGMLLCLGASAMVNSTMNKYSKVRNMNGITGAEAARRILNQEGLYNVQIECLKNSSGDHYDPRTNTVRLSYDNYNGATVTAVSVAAHECGHAIQDHESYVPLRLRHFLVPIVNFGNTLSMPLFVIGLLLGMYDTLVPIGIFLFSFAVLFQFVTLPVEFNASSRAVAILGDSGMVTTEELPKVKKVLRAAAYTYLAAAAASALQLLRLLLLSRRRRD